MKVLKRTLIISYVSIRVEIRKSSIEGEVMSFNIWNTANISSEKDETINSDVIPNFISLIIYLQEAKEKNQEY